MNHIMNEEMDSSDSPNDENKLSKRNTGWADAIAKVLKQKPGGKVIVLSRAKKINDTKETIVKEDFEIVKNESLVDDDEEEDDEKKPIIVGKKLIKEHQLNGRIKPDILDKDREKMLAKIATRGVVQLFNAVRQQQKSVDKTLKKAGKSERKREKLLETIDKRKFLNVLSKKSTVPEIKSEDEDMEVSEEGNTWSVLSDNFMMGSKLKDWDKYEEEEV